MPVLLVQGPDIRNQCTGLRFPPYWWSQWWDRGNWGQKGDSYLVRELADRERFTWQLFLQVLGQTPHSLVMSRCQFYSSPATWTTGLLPAGGALSTARDFSLDKRHYRKQKRLDGLSEHIQKEIKSRLEVFRLLTTAWGMSSFSEVDHDLIKSIRKILTHFIRNNNLYHGRL